MEQFKRVQVIMLPTENKINGSIVKDIKEESKILHIKQKDYCEHEDFVAQHLYIISDDEAKENDLYIESDHKGFGFRKYKIIATTDTSLLNTIYTPHISGEISKRMRDLFKLPQPSEQFITKYIEKYNKGNIITDVLVEYETYQDTINYHKDIWKNFERIKINSKDNSITIKKLKDNWNREEVIGLLKLIKKDTINSIELDIDSDNLICDLNINKWIEENL